MTNAAVVRAESPMVRRLFDIAITGLLGIAGTLGTAAIGKLNDMNDRLIRIEESSRYTAQNVEAMQRHIAEMELHIDSDDKRITVLEARQGK
jgi:hypothetical protein